MNTFHAHSSVRVKGCENNYSPVQCFDPNCVFKTAHMHCPFCVKTESYQDPVILKAHYRVKHVDKGVEFAGLKILRCCDYCDIVGAIKGEKKFKKAHWHCYKCRNGFNRRDEAIKHYKTHFRNPQTTFQIQISQDVNQDTRISAECPLDPQTISEVGADGLSLQPASDFSIHPVLTEAVMTTSPMEHNTVCTPHDVDVSVIHSKASGADQEAVAANETVEEEPTQTIMIIQDYNPADIENTYSTGGLEGEEITAHVLNEQSKDMKNTISSLHLQYQNLEAAKLEMEQQLKEEIVELKAEISVLMKREQDLLSQLSIPLDRNIMGLLQKMEKQHKDLIHQQLVLLRREYMSTQKAQDASTIAGQGDADQGQDDGDEIQVDTDQNKADGLCENQGSVSEPNMILNQENMTESDTGLDMNQASVTESGTAENSTETMGGPDPNVTTSDCMSNQIMAEQIFVNVCVDSFNSGDLPSSLATAASHRQSIQVIATDDATLKEPRTEHVSQLEEISESPPAKRRKES